MVEVGIRIIKGRLHIPLMKWVGPVEWVKSLRYRPRFLGWFVASIFMFLSATTWLIIFLALTAIEILPENIGLLGLGFHVISVAAVVYSITRMMAPAEPIMDALRAKRRKLVWGLFGLFFLMFLVINTLTRLYGVPMDSLTSLAPFLAIIIYGTPMATAYDAARLKNTDDRIEVETNPQPLPDVLMGKSRKKVAFAAVGLLSITVVVGMVESPLTGLSAAAALAGIVGFLGWLYPAEE